jgi:hypothetical protein
LERDTISREAGPGTVSDTLVVWEDIMARRRKKGQYTPAEIFMAIMGLAFLVLVGGMILTSLF